MQVFFRETSYEAVFTHHAKQQMALRNLTDSDVIEIIERGEFKAKETGNKFWVYREVPGRKDNRISVSISIETPRLIVITAMVNWRPG